MRILLFLMSIFLVAPAFGQVVSRTELRNTNNALIAYANSLFANAQPLDADLTTIGSLGNVLSDRILFRDESDNTWKYLSIGTTLAITGTTLDLSGVGGGDVTAASAFGTDNRLIRSDGTGKGVQASSITLEDAGNLIGVTKLGFGASEAFIDSDAGNVLNFLDGDETVMARASNGNFHVTGTIFSSALSIDTLIVDRNIHVRSNVTEFAATAYVKADLDIQGKIWVLTNSMTGNMFLAVTNIASLTNNSIHFTIEGEAAGGTDRYVTNTFNTIGNTIPMRVRNGSSASQESPLVWLVPAGTVVEGDIAFSFHRGTNYGNAITNVLTR